MKPVNCSSCAKQVVTTWTPSWDDKRCTTSEGAKPSFPGEVFCGYCAEELDENGMFPEEHGRA